MQFSQDRLEINTRLQRIKSSSIRDLYLVNKSDLTDLNLNEDIEKDILDLTDLNLNKDIEKDIFHGIQIRYGRAILAKLFKIGNDRAHLET